MYKKRLCGAKKRKQREARGAEFEPPQAVNQSSDMAFPEQQYCLRWNNHGSNFVTVFEQLLRTESFTDVTISVQTGASIKCHKMVLAACSSYFQELFLRTPCEHPVVVFSEVNFADIKAILDYMYKGEVNVSHDQLPSLLRIARFLRVKGLVEENDVKMDYLDPSMSPAPTNGTSTSSHTHSSGYGSPPHIPSTFTPYGKSPVERNHSHLPLWATFPGIAIPHHPISGHQPPPRNHSILGSSYENTTETSPLSRKKLSSIMANRDTPILRNVLGQGHAENPNPAAPAHQDRQDASFCSNSNGSIHDSDRRNSAELSETMIDEDEKEVSQNVPTTSKSGSKPEWKRYKQYTREHIMDAMAAVSKKEMSALQAARKFGVPSRTLYDKLKKAGILPSRSAAVQQRRESHSGSARFPYSPSVNGVVYGNGLAIAAVNGGSVHSESEGEAIGENSHGKMKHEPADELVMDMSTRSPSPALRVPVPPPRIDEQVEDLSVSRSDGKSAAQEVTLGGGGGGGVIVQPPSHAVKQEDLADSEDSEHA